MSAASVKIRDEVRHLPFGERLRLVKELEEDLDSDKPVDEAWDSEEQSRVDEIMSGQVRLMSGEDLTRRLGEVLLERSCGPFETVDPFDEKYWEDIKAEGRKHAEAGPKDHA